MDDEWQHLGGRERALEQQELLLAQGGRSAPDSVAFPLNENFVPNSDAVFQYPNRTAADDSSGPLQDVASSSDTPTTPSPKVLRSRPGAYERRTDGEPRVYRELPSFQSFDEPIPTEATLEEICIQYPNHLRGSYLDAFIQYRWTATDIFIHLSDKAKQEFRICGISRARAFGNRANFLSKRLNGRMNDLTAEQMTALCTAPKIRGCLIDGTELYGACKLQGKFFNPAAPPVRSFPERRNQARKGRASTATAATKTFTLNGRECRLWDSTNGLDKFKRSMATHWDRQRGYAEVVINADVVHASSKNSQRNQLILQITDWPANAATETFFCFDHVEDCPKFLSTLHDMVAAGVVDLLRQSADTDIGRQLRLARQATIEHILSIQVDRVAKLRDFAATLPVGSVTFGLVDQVLSWSGGVVQGFAALTGPSQASFGAKVPLLPNLAGANMFAGNGKIPQVCPPSLDPLASSRHPLGRDIAISRDPLGSNIFDICFDSMEAGQATHTYESLPLRPILRKRAGDELPRHTAPPKRLRPAQPAITQGQSLLGGGNHSAAVPMPTGAGDPTPDPFAFFDDTLADQFNTEHTDVASLPTIPEGIPQGCWPVSGMSNNADFWATAPEDNNLLWPEFDMGSGFTPDDILQAGLGTALPDLAEPCEPVPAGQPFSAADLTFGVAPLEDLWGVFNIDSVPGELDGQLGENMELTPGIDTTQGGAGSTLTVTTDTMSCELPELEDNDQDWLKQEIYRPF